MKKTLLTAAILAAAPLASQAVDFSYKGFGSLIGGMSTDQVDFQPNVKYGDGYYDQSFDIAPESRLALQLTAQFTDQVSVVGQVITRGANDWDIDLPWLYLNYQATDSVQIRAGRMKAPYYPYSDFQDVGYALPWVSTPTNAYIVPADYINGINVLTNFSTGAIDHTVELYGSVMNDTTEFRSSTPDLEFNDSEIYGISLTSTYDWLTTRMTYNEAKLDMESSALEGLQAGLAGVLGANSSMAIRTRLDGQKASFIGLSARGDFDKLFVIAEYNLLDWNTYILPHQERAFISAGYSVTEKFTPYLTLSKNDDNDTSVTTTGGVIPGVDGALLGLSKGSNAEGWALGARYDLMPDVALKAEYSSTNYDDLANDENTFRVGVDFLF